MVWILDELNAQDSTGFSDLVVDSSQASLQMSVVVESTGTGSAELVWDVVCMTNTTAAPASFNQVSEWPS